MTTIRTLSEIAVEAACQQIPGGTEEAQAARHAYGLGIMDGIQAVRDGNPEARHHAGLPEAGPLDDLIVRVRAERKRQDELHPRDDWPMYDEPTPLRWVVDVQRENEINEAVGSVTWSDLLREELLEAMCETDPEGQVRELVELAALALRAAEAIGGRA